MDRREKEAFIASLRAAVSGASLVVVAEQRGLTVADVTDLRRKMLAQGASYKVIKNTLAKIALEGTMHVGLQEKLSGPVALGYSDDPIAAAKVLVEFSNSSDKLKVLGGSMNGEILTVEAIKALATLPSLDVLRGKLVGLLVAPATKIARVLMEPGAKLARVVNAYATK